MRVVNWNIERKAPHTWQAQSLVSEILGLGPDIVCLTEAYENSLASIGGYSISVAGVDWSARSPNERNVLLWSSAPWSQVECPRTLNQIGAAITGVTEFGTYPVRFLGLCVPYHMASPFGVEPRAAPWSEQEQFLDHLGPLLANWRSQRFPIVVVGDFNQFIPRVWGSQRAHEKLLHALGGMYVATSGLHSGFEKHAVDHIVMTHELDCISVLGRSRFDDRQKARSDHFGVVVDMTFR